MTNAEMVMKNPNNFLAKTCTFGSLGFGSKSNRFSRSSPSVGDKNIGPGRYNDKYYSIEEKNSEIKKGKKILGVSNKYAVYNFPIDENSKKKHSRN